MPLDKPASQASLQELESLLKDPIDFRKFAEAEPVTPESEPIPIPVPVPASPPPEPETTPSTKPEETPKEVVEAQQENLDLDILRARLEETEARLAKQEKLAGRQAGEIGFKQQQKIRELEAEVQRLQSRISNEEALSEPAPATPTRTAPTTLPDSATAYLVNMAVSNAGEAFFRAYPDAQELAPAMREYLQNSGQDVSAILETNDPVEAARRTTMLFEEALQHVKYDRARTRRTELETRRADQIKNLDEAKRKATLSGSGSSTPPTAIPTTPTKKTLAELEAELKRLDEEHGRRM